jgi:hypothetical protein
MVRGIMDIGCEMPNAGYTTSIANGTNIKKQMLSPIKNSSFSAGFLVNFSICISKNPGRNVSNTNPRTCLKTGISKMMDMSVKAINANVNAHTLFEPKVAIFALSEA